jgi:hypothetical protein
MKIGTFAIAAGALALGLATWMTPGKAQGPLYDRVNVNLPYSVTIGDRTLQPGDYVIQQLRDAGGGSRVLLIYSDNGMRFETSAMTIPTLDQNTPENTKVVLHHFGPDYYFDKVWIQGKNYGYEFPLPDSVKAREKERMQPISVAATYQASPAPTETATTTNKTTTATTARQTTEAATQQTTTAATSQHTTTPAATQPTTTAQSATTTPGTMAPATSQSTATATTSTTSAQSTAPAATTQASTTMRSDQNSANREMPNTSAGWLMMMLSGGALSGAGVMLRRKR